MLTEKDGQSNNNRSSVPAIDPCLLHSALAEANITMETKHWDNGHSSAPVIDPRLLQAITEEIPANKDLAQPEMLTAI